MGENMHKLVGCGEIPRCIPSWRVADNLGTNLVEVIEVFIREMEEFTPFILIHS